jgi:hypothetical protein
MRRATSYLDRERAKRRALEHLLSRIGYALPEFKDSSSTTGRSEQGAHVYVNHDNRMVERQLAKSQAAAPVHNNALPATHPSSARKTPVQPVRAETFYESTPLFAYAPSRQRPKIITQTTHTDTHSAGALRRYESRVKMECTKNVYSVFEPQSTSHGRPVDGWYWLSLNGIASHSIPAPIRPVDNARTNEAHTFTNFQQVCDPHTDRV